MHMPHPPPESLLTGGTILTCKGRLDRGGASEAEA